MANDNVRQKIRDYISECLRAKRDTAPFSDADILMTKGRLDSLDTLNVVMFLEEQFKMDFSDGLDKNLLIPLMPLLLWLKAEEVISAKKSDRNI